VVRCCSWGVAVSCVAFCMLQATFKVTSAYGTSYFSNTSFTHRSTEYLRGSIKTTRFDVTVVVAYLVANVLSVTIGVRTASKFLERTRRMAMVNLIPLAPGGHMNHVASRCGISSENIPSAHYSCLLFTTYVVGWFCGGVFTTMNTPPANEFNRVSRKGNFSPSDGIWTWISMLLGQS